MKKIIITFAAALFIGVNAYADKVSSSTALSVARKFMDASSLTLVWDGNDARTRSSSDDPAFYVYNVTGGGWVIVSAEDSTMPILGYSDTGSFRTDGMPENIRHWFGMMQKDILRSRADGVKASAEVRARWENPRPLATRAGSSGKVELTTAKWDQSSPYNNYLSTYVKKGSSGVSNLLTGCVATAMAEVLYYHKWPEKGTGTIGNYTTNTGKYTVSSIDISSHTYDWDNMLSAYGNSASTNQKNAVALLMLDCGVMVEMDYGTSSAGGSGAYSEDIVPALVEHMGYSKQATLRYRANYSTRKWMEMIEYEIDNNGPVLYSGSGDDGGHQFVCDGYDADNTMLHFNWGWSGSSNGYFTLELSNAGGYTFDEGQSAIFGLVPDKTGTSEYGDCEITMLNYDFDDYPDAVNGIEIVSGTVAKGETFSIIAGKLYNGSTQNYTGALKVVLQDKDGNWKEDLCDPLEMIEFCGDEDGFGAGWVVWFDESEALSCTITNDIAFGDRIAFWYRLNDGSWTPVVIDHEDLTVPWEWACVDACIIKTEDSYSAGDVFYYELIPGNTGISSISWKFDGKSTTDFATTLTSGTHTVSAAVTFTDGTSETITQTIVVK